MHIEEERVNALHLVVTIKISPEDYRERTKKAVKEYAKRTKHPGFRPGMTPPKHIEKLYGKELLMREVQALLSESLNDYLNKNSIETLGEPLPKLDPSKEVQWGLEETFECSYELCLVPEFTVDLSSNDQLTERDIRHIQEDEVDDFVRYLHIAYGTRTPRETATEESWLSLAYRPFNEDGSVNHDRVYTNEVCLKDVTDASIKNLLVGLRSGAVIPLHVLKDTGVSLHSIADLLGIDVTVINTAQANFLISITNIYDIQEVSTQELIDDCLGIEASNEQELKLAVKDLMEQSLRVQLQRELASTIHAYLLNKIPLPIPEKFLKHWFDQYQENVGQEAQDVYTDETHKERYRNFTEILKWKLIRKHIMKCHDLVINIEDVIAITKEYLKSASIWLPAIRAQSHSLVEEYLQNKKNFLFMTEETEERKVLDYLKRVITFNKHYVDYGAYRHAIFP